MSPGLPTTMLSFSMEPIPNGKEAARRACHPNRVALLLKGYALYGGIPRILGKPPHALGELPRALREPPEALGAPPEAVGKPPEALGEPPETLGEPPEALGEPPETVGDTPRKEQRREKALKTSKCAENRRKRSTI
jgi:hypothetical protein